MIAVLEKTFEILELLNASGTQPMMLKEIVELSGINQPTCARILQNLSELGYAKKFGPRQGYVIGPMSEALGSGQTRWSRWGQLAAPLIEQLAKNIFQFEASFDDK